MAIWYMVRDLSQNRSRVEYGTFRKLGEAIQHGQDMELDEFDVLRIEHTSVYNNREDREAA